jgi:hypothetical protein
MELKAICILFCLTFGDGSPSVDAARFCAVAKPIYWSRVDTRYTKEQADEHNRKGKAICGWGKK